jgi:hypothetical protein
MKHFIGAGVMPCLTELFSQPTHVSFAIGEEGAKTHHAAGAALFNVKQHNHKIKKTI